MVMKRYPNGWNGPFFFMKRTPPGAPEWLNTCAIRSAPLAGCHYDLADWLWRP
jgi:bifunctional non-homologous end joining protein LigD